jgi:signal peptidase I
MTKGYFTIAQGEKYQRMAYALALSLKLSQPEEYSKLSIGVTKDEIENINPKYLKVFDKVVEIPWDDSAKDSNWKLENEWKVIYMTPYDETIKLDADMLFLNDISHWWKCLEESDGVFATDVYTYRGDKVTNDYYRKVYTENNLPNVYTAFFYFKKNEINFELFKWAQFIFDNWEKCFYELLGPEHRPKFVSTDVVFALAAKIVDYEQHNKLPTADMPTFVHMKSRLQGWPEDQFMQEDWTKMLKSHFSRDCNLQVGNYRQMLPFHYHVKDFLTDKMIYNMERKLGL